MSSSFGCTIGKFAVGRTTSLSSIFETFSGSALFLSVIAPVLGSLNSNYPQLQLFFALFLNFNDKLIDTTSSLLLLSSLLGESFIGECCSQIWTQGFRVLFISVSFFHQLKSFGNLFSLFYCVHNFFVRFPMMLIIREFLYLFPNLWNQNY